MEYVEVQPEGLHGTGRTTSGRSSGAGSSARGVKTGLETAGNGVGHFIVKSAASTFLTNNILDDANGLESQVEAAGINVSNVASTTRDADNEGGQRLNANVSTGSDLAARVNKSAAV